MEHECLSIQTITTLNFNRLINVDDNHQENVIWCNKNFDYLEKNIIKYDSQIENMLKIRVNEERINSFDLSSANIKEKYKKLKDKISIINNKSATNTKIHQKSLTDILTKNSYYKLAINLSLDENGLVNKLNQMEFTYNVTFIISFIL